MALQRLALIVTIYHHPRFAFDATYFAQPFSICAVLCFTFGCSGLKNSQFFMPVFDSLCHHRLLIAVSLDIMYRAENLVKAMHNILLLKRSCRVDSIYL